MQFRQLNLPPEILSCIFRAGCEEAKGPEFDSYPDMIGLGAYDHRKKPFAKLVGRVCSSWKRIVEADPRVWVSRVMITGSEDSMIKSVNDARSGLETHPGCDIHVFITDEAQHFGTNETMADGFMNAVALLKEFAHRLRYLCLARFRASSTVKFHSVLLEATSFGSLETLEIQDQSYYFPATRNRLIINPLFASRLSHLLIRAPDVLWEINDAEPSMFSTLRTVDLQLQGSSFNFRGIIRGLERMRNLETLKLEMWQAWDVEPIPAKTCLSIKNLSIGGSILTLRRTLCSLDLPCLENIHFPSRPPHTPLHPSNIGPEVFPNLCCLTMDSFCPAIVEMLSDTQMPKLTSLVVSQGTNWKEQTINAWKGGLTIPLKATHLKNLKVSGIEEVVHAVFRCLQEHPPDQLQSLTLLREGKDPKFLHNIPLTMFHSLESLRLKVVGCKPHHITTFYWSLESLKRLELYFGDPSSRDMVPKVATMRGTENRDLSKLETVVLFTRPDPSERTRSDPFEKAPEKIRPEFTVKECSTIVKLAESCKANKRPLKLLTFDTPVLPAVRKKLTGVVEQLVVPDGKQSNKVTRTF